jgi:hypothetical protein
MNIGETKKHRQKCVDLYKTANGCEICGYNKCPRALCFDHLPEYEKREICKNGYSKSNSCGGMQMLYHRKHDVTELIEEIKKCRLLCMNCHIEQTYQNRTRHIADQSSMSLDELETILSNPKVVVSPNDAVVSEK